MKRTSIKDIAEELGISNATVSLVLSGKAKDGRVSFEMAEKIKETAKLMNYHANGLARGLRMGHSQTLGLIVADISNPFFGSLAFQIQKEAEKFDYTIIIANTNESDEKMEKIIEILKSRQVDGFIIVPTEHSETLVDELRESKTPMVLIDRYFPNIHTSNVVVDNYRASYEATNLLISDGSKRIALVIYNSNMSHIQDRRNGFIDALNKAQIYDPKLVCKVNYGHIEEDIAKGMDKFMSMEDKPDGIFFTTNTLSIIGLKEMIKRGIKIQDDIKIVCFDENDAFNFDRNPIPYVKQPIEQMGSLAVDILVNQITRQDVNVITSCLSAEIISPVSIYTDS